MKITYFSSLLFLFILDSNVRAQSLLDKFFNVVTGVEAFFSTTFVTNCQDIKGIFGINYDQFVANNKTPNMSQVQVGIQVNNISYMYNISTSAANILSSGYFNNSLPIAFYVHGYLSNTNTPNLVQMVSSLVRRGGYNVLFIDASSLIYLFYMWATTCVEFIGMELGRQLAQFATAGVKPQDIYLLGFSLGAHISGFAGQMFKNITGSRVGRISAFDAAGPCYFNAGINERLSPDDADFVDAIHTNAGVMGIIIPIGHVDFYVNGGSTQPQSYGLFDNHLKSWVYMNETLLRGNEYNFAAVKCPSWNDFQNRKCLNNEKTYMGIITPKNTTGIFYLRTADTAVHPYGLKEDGIVPVVDPFMAFIIWLLSLFRIYI